MPLAIRGFLLVVFLATGFPVAASAQRLGGNNVPNDTYSLGFAPFANGDFDEAQKIFRDAARSGVRFGEARWIDTVCFHTMLGECYYRMGDMNQALDQYSSAIKYYMANRDWLLRVEFPATIETQTQTRGSFTWGNTQRTIRLGKYDDHYSTLVGRFDNDKVVQQGGVVAPPQLYPVNVTEVMRCFSQSIRRRREIMGPVCEHDPLTGQLLEMLARRPGQPNHWSQCWLQLPLGLAYASAGKREQAVSEITQSILAGGSFEHPLSAMAMLELGRLAFEKGEYPAAGTYFVEATYSAGLYDQYDILEESFRWGATTWAVSGKAGVFPPLANAAAWTKAKKLKTAHVSLLTSAAEGLLDKGDVAAANQLISQARAVITKSDLLASDLGSRLNFVTASAFFQAGQLDQGAAALAAAVKWQSGGSKRLYQIALADGLVVSNQVTERVADILYADTLREPTASDWLIDPYETLAVIAVPHPLPYEHWFEVALARKELENALTIADRLRRHRFYSTLPLGGRLMALRWILEAPAETLTNDVQLQKQNLLVKHPILEQATRKAADLKAKLLESEPDSKGRQEIFADYTKAVALQEVTLRDAALRREPSDFVFPPLRETKDIREKLPPETLVLAYFATSRAVHAFAMTREQFGHWIIDKPNAVKTDLQEVYKSWGLHDKSQPVQMSDLKETAWKVPAGRIGAALTNNMKPADWAKYKEVVIIPDRMLWHVPFEMLPAGKDASEPLLSQIQVRYVPTVGLIRPDSRPLHRSTRLGLSIGKLPPREQEAGLRAAIDDAVQGSDKLEKWDTPTSVPSRLTVQACDRLLTIADHDDAEKGPYDWAPLANERSRPGSTLSDWSCLPWGGPVEVTLPGYRTAAESGLKKGGTGDEIFLTLCGLMSTGPRTVLLSRWRVGGQSSLDLVREYHQELGHTSAAAAWRRSVRLLREGDLTLDREPRVRGGSPGDFVRSEHPFFWAGYLLCDTGTEAEEKK